MDSFRQDHKKFIKKPKIDIKSPQRFNSEKHNLFTEEVNKIALSASNDKRIQSKQFNRNICIRIKQISSM